MSRIITVSGKLRKVWDQNYIATEKLYTRQKRKQYNCHLFRKTKSDTEQFVYIIPKAWQLFLRCTPSAARSQNCIQDQGGCQIVKSHKNWGFIKFSIWIRLCIWESLQEIYQLVIDSYCPLISPCRVTTLS